MPRFSFRSLAAAGSALAATLACHGFELIGRSWPDGEIVMHLQLGSPANALADGSADWAVVAESALNEWNTQLVRSKFTAIRNSTAAIDPRNRINNVVFRSAPLGGGTFDSRTLAVTETLTSTTTGVSTECDVTFNSNLTWDSYRGPLRTGVRDLRRVALHEFGHVLGLDHPDEASEHFQNLDAIMNSTVSNTEVLRPDDITGVKVLYDTATDRTLPVNSVFTLSVPNSGAGFTYTWYFRAAGSTLAEPFHLATGPSYTINSVQLADAGTFVATSTSPAGVFSSSVLRIGVTAISTTPDATLANLSTRGVVGTGNSALIAGFVIRGSASKTILVRAVGPALADFGVAGALTDPLLVINNSAGQAVAQNDNWDASGNSTAISAAATRLGAFQFKAGSRDAAVLTTLPPGNYSAVVSGVNNATGTALVEVYDADASSATSANRLINIATRGQVSTTDPLIAGLVVNGPGPRTYLIRAVGPTLINAPFNISDALRDPFLQLYRGDTLLRENDDIDAPFASLPTLRTAAQQVGAFALRETRLRANGPSASGLDAAMLVTLQPGAYTAKVTGFEGATGVALIEIYEMP